MKLLIYIFFIIGGILAFWWVGVLILLILSKIWIPLLIAISIVLCIGVIYLLVKYNRGKNNKVSSKNILTTIAILSLTTIGGFVVYSIVQNSYPLTISNYDDPILLNEYKTRLVEDRKIRPINDTLFFADLQFGMSKQKVLQNIRNYKISKDIFFNDYTYSALTIDNYKITVAIKYIFDNNKLTQVYIKPESCDAAFFEAYIKRMYGKYYLDDNGSCYWVFNKILVKLSNKITECIIIDIKDIDDSPFNYIFEDIEQDGTLFYSPILDYCKKITTPLKCKHIPVFLDFAIGMTKQEVLRRIRELSQLGFFVYDTEIKKFNVNRFYFKFNANDSIPINNIDFIYGDGRLSKLAIYEDGDNNMDIQLMRNKLLLLYKYKYGEPTFIVYPDCYYWIMPEFTVIKESSKCTYMLTKDLLYEHIEKWNSMQKTYFEFEKNRKDKAVADSIELDRNTAIKHQYDSIEQANRNKI